MLTSRLKSLEEIVINPIFVTVTLIKLKNQTIYMENSAHTDYESIYK